VIFFDAIGKIRTSKVFFCRSSDELKRQFRCSDVVVVINLKPHFDVVMVCKFFDVLFGFQLCDFCSSDLSPNVLEQTTESRDKSLKSHESFLFKICVIRKNIKKW
jgi:hypothetical protein